MIPPVPNCESYGITRKYGFLPPELPLERLSDPYYAPWEALASNLQALILSRRLRGAVQGLPILSTSRLHSGSEWRRAYVVLAFLTHAYIWGGELPADRIPKPIAIPFMRVCNNLELPPVATFAGLCLWNFKPIFADEPIDKLENLATLMTFTGSTDESWFYLISAAIEARGGPLIAMMLDAMQSARANDSVAVTTALQQFAERLDEIGQVLSRMHERCDPHVFYHHVRPFLAGSQNMSEAGLPNGVLFEDGSGTEQWRQYGGGSNAQSSLIQFFDIVLGIVHRPTGEGPRSHGPSDPEDAPDAAAATAPPVQHNFILDMRRYMPGPHRRFLTDVAAAANLRAYVEAHPADRALTLAYDACLAMLRVLRDIHIQLVSRYIIVKARDGRSANASPTRPGVTRPVNLASVSSTTAKRMRGTGGTALLPFLKQARDETGEPAIDAWARRLLGDMPILPAMRKAAAAHAASVATMTAETATAAMMATQRGVELGTVGEHADGDRYIVGLAGTWGVDETESGGICHW